MIFKPFSRNRMPKPTWKKRRNSRLRTEEQRLWKNRKDNKLPLGEDCSTDKAALFKRNLATLHINLRAIGLDVMLNWGEILRGMPKDGEFGEVEVKMVGSQGVIIFRQ